MLRAARNAGVKRVVMTSSFAAVGYGHPERTAAFDERDWTDVSGPGVTAYAKSKTLAERAAWDFIAAEGNNLELSVVNPVGVFGPVLSPDISPSILVVQKLLDGALPGCPRVSFGVVDVRDVVDLHLRAMTCPAAKGERFLAVAGEPMWFVEIAKLLKAHLGDAAKRVPVRQLPDWLLKLAALRDPAVKLILPEIGKWKRASHAKAERLLQWAPRSNQEAILATAESIVSLGLWKGAK